jgi:hypothetical protein
MPCGSEAEDSFPCSKTCCHYVAEWRYNQTVTLCVAECDAPPRSESYYAAFVGSALALAVLLACATFWVCRCSRRRGWRCRGGRRRRLSELGSLKRTLLGADGADDDDAASARSLEFGRPSSFLPIMERSISQNSLHESSGGTNDSAHVSQASSSWDAVVQAPAVWRGVLAAVPLPYFIPYTQLHIGEVRSIIASRRGLLCLHDNSTVCVLDAGTRRRRERHHLGGGLLFNRVRRQDPARGQRSGGRQAGGYPPACHDDRCQEAHTTHAFH